MRYQEGVFFLLSKTLDLALSPLSWGLTLLILALVAWKRRPWLAQRALGAALLVVTLFSLGPVANGLIRSLEIRAAHTFRGGETYDAVLLLAGVVDDRPTGDRGVRSYNDSFERVIVAFDLLREQRARFVVVSGGPADRTAEVVEAAVIADQLVVWGIGRDRIVVDRNATNTRENAIETSRIAGERGWSRLVVVTSAFHMARALGCYRAVGLQVDALPVDYRSYDPARHDASWAPRAGFLAQSTWALRELAGGFVYHILGYSR